MYVYIFLRKGVYPGRVNPLSFMKRNSRTLITTAGIAFLLVLLVICTGCTQQPAAQATVTPTATTAPATVSTTNVPTAVSTPVATPVTTVMSTPKPTVPPGGVQKVKVSGSTTVLPVAQNAADALMDANPAYDIQVSGGGSSVGITSVGEGTSDIGMSSRDVKAAEMTKYPALKIYTVANDGIAVIVNPANTVNALSLQEIKGIYKGEYNNWKQLGGPDMTIVVVGRDSASGTREYFFEAVMNKENFVSSMLEKNSNGAVKQTVQQTPGAIGYVSIGFLDPAVKALQIRVKDTLITANSANVRNKTYPISRALYMITKGEPSAASKAYLDFVMGPDGQKIVTEEGYVPIL